MIRKSISITNRKCAKFTSLSPASCNNNGMMIDRCLLPHCHRQLSRANIISSRSDGTNSYNGRSGILTSFFSTNPSYDDIEDEDDLDNDVETTTWIKRSPGINNLSSTHYSNTSSNNSGGSSYCQYEVSRPPPPRQGLGRDTDRKQYANDIEEDGSLLNLLNYDSSTNQHQQQSRLDNSQQDRYNNRIEEEEEGSLLNLLNTSQSNSSSNYTTPISPRHYMPQSNQNQDKDEHEKINSLLGLLGGRTSIDEGVIDNDNRKEGGEGSLLNLLGSASEDESALDGESLLYPTLNGYQPQQQQQQVEEEDNSSMLDLLASPPSTTTSTNTSNKKCYKHLQSLQLQLELESLTQSTTKQLEIYNSARDRSDYNTIPVVKRALDNWYKELNEIIEIEQWLYLNGDNNTISDVSLLNTNDDIDINDTNTNEEEGEAQTTKQRKVRDRSIYGPLLCLLPSRKLSVIVANSVLSALLSDKHGYIKVVQLAILISNAIEMEVNVSRALRVKAKERKIALVGNDEENEGGMLLGDEEDDTPLNIDHRTIGGASKQRVSIKPFNMNGEDEVQAADNKKAEQGEGIIIDNYIYTATHLQRFLDELPGNGNNTDNGGGNNQKSLKNIGQIRPEKVRRRCKEILLAEGFDMKDTREEDDNYSTSISKENINDFVEWDPVQKVKLGCALIQLLLDNTTFTKPTKDGKQQQQRHGHTEPAFQYKRKMMGNKNGKAHGVIEIHPELHSIAVNEEFTSTSMYISPSLANSRVQPMVVPPNDWLGVNDGGYETIKVPFMRTRHCKTQKDSIHRADLSKVMEGLNALGKIPWKINKTVLDAAWKCWDDGIVLGDIPAQVDFEVPPLPPKMEYKDYKTLGDLEKESSLAEYRKYREQLSRHNRFKQKNMDLHSLRCSAMLKLNQATKFQDYEEIFFPYNVDFRGRAYPVTPHLSIVGSDLCRALLMFSDAKPLGKNGLYWLKVHLANLAGADKMSFDGRAQFSEDNMDNIRAAVDDPFGDNDWWQKFDDPFQGLATCHEIVKAIDSGDPENYMCNLPVHMDGSCNGLQHYAALGRDKGGGKAVNLCIANKPQDVYIGVMHEVVKRVAADAAQMIPFDENKKDLTTPEKDLLKKIKSARLVNGLIDRGVVKRTVMTSVYGVTFIGAKNQIEEKIEEKLEEKGFDIHEKEPEINTACGYLASLTMEVMGEQFKGARQTMNWLTQCARLIAAQGQPVAFVSPIGVPVVQPYRQRRPFTVVTLLQQVTLTNDSDVLPLHKTRQVSAFPPNYVHSLDSSHMLLTAIEMQKKGLHFSAVHDSYWTHPCDIEEMNEVLRESFIDLYNQPLLEDLRQTWQMRYPSIDFPEIPEEGDLDLNDVRSAPYFFQ